jgi:hypothetical protein
VEVDVGVDTDEDVVVAEVVETVRVLEDVPIDRGGGEVELERRSEASISLIDDRAVGLNTGAWYHIQTEPERKREREREREAIHESHVVGQYHGHRGIGSGQQHILASLPTWKGMARFLKPRFFCCGYTHSIDIFLHREHGTSPEHRTLRLRHSLHAHVRCYTHAYRQYQY